MGLIQTIKGAAKEAITGTLQDQFEKAIRCEDLGNDILMMKKTTQTGRIPNKSTIIVAPGQCAVIFDNGRIIDAAAEEGLYVFDESSSPSFFAGQFGEVFKEMWQRFTYEGKAAKEQAVYFFNTKEITENKFGTQVPMAYQDWGHAMTNRIDGQKRTPLNVKLKCFGTYTFKVSNPAVFMNEIAGSADIYRKESITEQMRAEVTEAFQAVLNGLGDEDHQVAYANLQGNTPLIKKMMSESVYDEAIRRRGLSIVSFTIGTVSLDDESEASIKRYEAMANEYLAQNRFYDIFDQSQSSQSSDNAGENANNQKTDATEMMMKMMAMNMMQGNIQNMNNQANMNSQANYGAQVPNQSQPVQNAGINNNVQNNSWTCPKCGNNASGNFCTNCGEKKPETVKAKYCTNCGEKIDNDAKFCSKCGTPVQ